MGEQSTKWVNERLQKGQEEGKSLVKKELNLSNDITKHIANSNCRKVILVLAVVDNQLVQHHRAGRPDPGGAGGSGLARET